MNFIVFAVTILVFIRTFAYAVWVKRKENNTAGSVCVFVICAMVLAVSLRLVF